MTPATGDSSRPLQRGALSWELSLACLPRTQILAFFQRRTFSHKAIEINHSITKQIESLETEMELRYVLRPSFGRSGAGDHHRRVPLQLFQGRGEREEATGFPRGLWGWLEGARGRDVMPGWKPSARASSDTEHTMFHPHRTGNTFNVPGATSPHRQGTHRLLAKAGSARDVLP